MRDELIVGYETLDEARQVRRALLRAGIVTKSHVSVGTARSFGPLRTRSERSGALIGVLAGGALGAVGWLGLTLVGDGGGVGLAVLLIGMGAGVGAFVGGVSGLSFGQVNSTDLTEHLAHDGYVVRMEVAGREQERAASKLLSRSRGALLARDSRMA